ncbi:biotin/lipoyl-containing protein [Phnomibacter ginsenosidimutans]|uniref:biotin/lipoyl-containing protein n=1 Tax=Phnomibacter ginsenosidimutans TaxID=2676868 RepID=UPI001FE9E388|nr:biotin/lipoyl-containing protein [Phnomibacter ginsenosidimutans]
MAEIETDKATMELESYQEGTLLHLGTAAGGKLQVDDLLVVLGTPGEDISALLAGGAAPAPAAAPVAEAPAAAPAAAASSLDLASIEEVVLMPRLSDTMTEGVIANWVKKVGETVSKGDVLAEIETDKATMELESYKNGVLLYQGAAAGEKIQVNDLLCIIGPADFKIDEIVAAAKAGAGAAPAAPKAEAAAPAATPAPAAAAPVAAAPEVVNTGRILASPLAKKLAADKGIDLRYVKAVATTVVLLSKT